MDTLANASSPALALAASATEYFAPAKDEKTLTPEEKKMMKKVEVLARIIAAVFGVYAFSLSWQCNRDTPTFLRIVYATVAFFMGFTYLVYYFFFRGECGLLLEK